MWPQYSLSRLFSLLFFGLVFSWQGLAQNVTPKRIPGVIESLQTIIEAHRIEYTEVLEKVNSRKAAPITLGKDNIDEYELDPLFLKSIFLHSEAKYIKLINNNQCSFVALLQNNLLKVSTGLINDILLKNKKSQVRTLIKKENYVAPIVTYQCINLIQIDTLFQNKNIKKTISGLNFPVPKTQKECHSIISDWKSNPYLPFICKVPESIKLSNIAQNKLSEDQSITLKKRKFLITLRNQGNLYRKNIPFFQRSYLKNLCGALQRPARFCSSYLATDVWSKVINGEEPQYKLYYKCASLYKKTKINLKELKNCAQRLNESPDLCINKLSKNFPSLSPKPNCSLLSQALNVSNLKSLYTDCPAYIDNHSLINIHRVFNHLQDRKVSQDPTNCPGEVAYSLAEIYNAKENESRWPFKLCYKDLIENKNICKIYIPGQLSNVDFSESNVVTWILKRINIISERVQCKVIPEKKYNPEFLDYKNGCFILFNKETCRSIACSKKVIVDGKEIKKVTYKGWPVFDYFPSSYIKSKESVTTIWSEKFKFKSKKILNLTQLELFFKQNKNSIIHGVACAEDLLPQFFKKTTFQQCRPLPFIVDGNLRQNSRLYLTMRTSIDDVHSPRLVPWNFVFNALSNFRLLHPLKTWALYGISK
jgi:hypothetical protein